MAVKDREHSSARWREGTLTCGRSRGTSVLRWFGSGIVNHGLTKRRYRKP